MYFPVPREVVVNGNVSIYMNGEVVKWDVVDEGVFIDAQGRERKFRYKTVLGTYPLLTWKIINPPKKFIVNVCYSYIVSKADDKYFKILYAMATGRFLQTYSKRCKAYITINFIGLRNTITNISLVPSPEHVFLGKTIWFYITYTLKQLYFSL